jgi:hypothetical protein
VPITAAIIMSRMAAVRLTGRIVSPVGQRHNHRRHSAHPTFMGRCPGLNYRGGCPGSLDASTGYCSLIAIRALTSFQHLCKTLESTAETQPQLQPVLLRLSAMISQYFTAAASCLFRCGAASEFALGHAKIPAIDFCARQAPTYMKIR